MGLLEKWQNFKENRRIKAIASNEKLVTNPKAMKEDRAAALEYFGSLEDPKVAVPALLRRFEYSLDHGINDTREKERAMAGIVRHKSGAVPLIQEHLNNTSRIAWPIKALMATTEEEKAVEVLKECLDFGEIDFDQSKVDKNFDILCYLADFSVPGFAEKLAHFLKSHDERIRFATVELLKHQDDAQIPKMLEEFLADQTSENTRLRQSVTEAFVEKGWQVSDDSNLRSQLAEQGVPVSSDGKIVAG